MKRILLLLTAICCCMRFTASAQLSPAYAARLQTVLDSMCDKYHIKGATAAVYVPGGGVWKGVHGDSYAGQPVTGSMAFPLNSNTKTYIAALLLRLQEEGMLQLSDTIGKWIQNRANISGQITIRQLLNHTSGLYSYTDTTAFSDSLEADFSRVWQPAEMLRFVGPPLFSPGAGWSYSNTNYLLAGMIIAQVTGMPVEQALRRKLLVPAGLANTWFFPQETPAAVIPHFWFFNGTGVDDGITYNYTPEAFYSAANSAGALFSTAEDNVIFWHKMIAGQVISATSLNEWRETIRLSNTVGYGLGVFRYRNFNGHVVYEHGGTGAGAINENLADSVSGVCISLLTNQDSAGNDLLLNGVIKALHKITNNPPTAVASVAGSSLLRIYPNPAREELRISWKGGAAEAYNYVVIDVTGKTVKNGVIDRSGSSIELPDLQNGTYYLQLSDRAGKRLVQAFDILR